MTKTSPGPGDVRLILCSVTVDQPNARVMLDISGGDGGSLPCKIRWLAAAPRAELPPPGLRHIALPA